MLIFLAKKIKLVILVLLLKLFVQMMKIYWIAKIGPKGQIVIPQEARQDLWIQPGDRVVIFSPSGKWIYILPEKDIKQVFEKFSDLLDLSIAKNEKI